MTSNLILSPYTADSTLIASSQLTGLSNGGYASAGVGTPTPYNNTAGKPYFRARLILPSAVTAGTSAPFVGVYAIPSLAGDGAAYPDPPGLAAEACPAQYHIGNILPVAGASFTSGILNTAVLEPNWYLFVLLNELGVGFPSGTVSFIGNSFSEQAG